METKKLKKYYSIAYFIIFALTIFAQYSHVYMYHDDYGYASLCYGISSKEFGVDVSLGKVLGYLKYHYFNVNGRVVAYLPLILSLRSGLLFTRLFMTLIITILYINLSKIILKECKCQSSIPIILILLSYGLFSATLVTGCHYWYSAAFGYVLPLTCFTSFVLLSANNNWLSLLAGFLLFVASASQEVIGVGVVSYVGFKFLFDCYADKTFRWKSFVFLIISLCGFAFVLLAPGNGNRIASQENIWFYELSVFDKIRLNIPYVVRHIFDKENRLLALFIYLCSALCSVKLILRTSGIQKALQILCAVSSAIMILISIFWRGGYYDFLHSNIGMYNILFLLQLCLLLYSIFAYLIDSNCTFCVFYLISGVLSLSSLLLVPSDVHNRATLFFQISMIFTIVVVLSNGILSIRKNALCYVALIAFSILPIVNFYQIFNGYKKNSDNNAYNDCVLRNAKKTTSGGVVYLRRLPEPEYADAQKQTYSGAKYIQDMIVSFYELPDETILIYK